MALTFRNTKGSALTHVEMDHNIATFYVSSSIEENTLKLFSQGSGSLSAVTHSLEIDQTSQQVCDNGNVTTTNITATNFITTSDRRLKGDITPIQNGLSTLKDFVSYEYKRLGNGGLKEAGFIAQEIEEAIPYAVQKGADGYLTMNDRPILAHMHKAILELEERLVALENKIG